MQDIHQQAVELQGDIQASLEAIDFADKSQKLERLNTESQQPNFWSNSDKAQAHMQTQSQLSAQLEPWRQLITQVNDIVELSSLNDETIKQDLKQQLQIAVKSYSQLKKQLQFSGPYDDHDVLLSIYAGAGGTDAQDWTAMLHRMYVRWAESQNLSVRTVDESAGEEAGLKSVSLEISGPFLYGKLKGEHGVHRLVRLSPFNADAKRQTSFAKVEILPKINAPDEVPLDDTELKIDVFRAGGHGGQSVNTTDSAVRITHLPTGITVSIQNERSQIQNKETALTILRSKLAQLQQEQHLETLAGIKGPNQSAEWGNQIRSYVLHPYTMVKDLRTKHETSNAQEVLDGKLDPFIDAYLEFNLI